MSTNPRRLGKYELQESLGHGGMAEVWKAFDSQLKRHVAIKLLRADLQTDTTFSARFTREAQVIASLQHPNIVQIYDFNVSQPPESERDTPYMVMRYVEGQTLASLIRRTSRMGNFPSPVAIVELFTPMGLAIDYAHQKGMIHRDIKPSNILLDERNTSHYPMGEPILSDFGIAKLLGVTTGTLTGGWLGTPHYTAPEQVMGAPGNERSDIYSLGVILYEICTGVLPFQGSTPTEIMMQHINMAPPAPMLVNPAIPPTLTGVILRALAKDPAARFPTACAMVIALAEAFNMPIPKALSGVSNPTEAMYSPTHLSPLSPRVLPAGTPFSGPSLVAPPPKPQPSQPMSIAQLASGADSGQGTLGVSSGNTPHGTPLPMSSAQLPAVAPMQRSISTILPGSVPAPLTPWPPVQPFPPAPSKRRRWLFVGLIVALILLLAGSGVGAFYLGRQSFFNQFVRQPIAGHAFFISSGQIGETSNQGIMDELQIELSGVSPPAAGNSYYGWLQPDNNQTTTIAPILLGPLPVTNGSISFHYPGNAQHTNLLATMSRFLITEESATASPQIPSPDLSTWRYGAQLLPPFSLPSIQSTPTLGAPNVAALTHLRGLLATEPELEAKGLPGGLDTWLFRNAEKVLEWSVSARDEWQTQGFPLLHRHIVRILDYLDGLSFVQQDAPGEQVYVSPVNGKIGLLDVDPHLVAHGLLYKTDVDLNALIQSSFLMPDQRTFAIKIDAAVRNVERWLSNVRKDAQQLEPLSAAQLAQPTTRDLLDTMSNEALSAFAGRIDPTSGNVQDGVIQIHYAIQRLATFNIHPDASNCFNYVCRKS